MHRLTQTTHALSHAHMHNYTLTGAYTHVTHTHTRIVLILHEGYGWVYLLCSAGVLAGGLTVGRPLPLPEHSVATEHNDNKAE